MRICFQKVLCLGWYVFGLPLSPSRIYFDDFRAQAPSALRGLHWERGYVNNTVIARQVVATDTESRYLSYFLHLDRFENKNQ